MQTGEKSLWSLLKVKPCSSSRLSEPVPLVRFSVSEALFGRREWKRGLGASSCFLIPAFPERLDGAAPVTDGAILITVTRYVKKPSQTLKIRAGFSGQSLFSLVQESRSITPPPPQMSHISVSCVQLCSASGWAHINQLMVGGGTGYLLCEEFTSPAGCVPHVELIWFYQVWSRSPG